MMNGWLMRRLWRRFMSYLDETGFGEPIREASGQVLAQLTVKTGQKGIHAGHLGWLMIVILALTTKGWLATALAVAISAAVILPMLARTIKSLVSPILFKDRRLQAGHGSTWSRGYAIRLRRKEKAR